MADRLPGQGLFGWLGRQVGYVKKAVTAKPAELSRPARGPAAASSAGNPSATDPAVIYREGRVEEADHPTRPGVKLRRTVIDEVIVDKRAPADRPNPPTQQPADIRHKRQSA